MLTRNTDCFADFSEATRIFTNIMFFFRLFWGGREAILGGLKSRFPYQSGVEWFSGHNIIGAAAARNPWVAAASYSNAHPHC